jgi:hypothetical protein
MRFRPPSLGNLRLAPSVHSSAHFQDQDAILKECLRAFSMRRRLEAQMRKALIIAAGLALFGTSAWSQSSSRDRNDYDRGGWRESRDRYDRDRDRDRWRGSIMRDDDEGDDHDDRPERGSRFFLRSGDTQLRVVCGSEESTQACVDAALRMFDRVQAQPRTATSSPAPAPTSPPTPQ